MNCPNCRQAHPEGAKICPFCGTVLAPSTPAGLTPIPPGSAPAIVPLAPPPPAAGKAAEVPAAGSSAPARASLWLGIGSLALLVLVVGATSVAVAVWLTGQPAELVTQLQGTPEEVQRLLEDPRYQDVVMTLGMIGLGGLGCSFLAAIAATLGLILGIMGMSREKSRPTRSGRTHSIVGIVFSTLPLLCCVGGCVVQLLSVAGG